MIGELARDRSTFPVSEELDLLTDYQDHLRFIREAVAVHASPARRAAYDARLDAIERRVSDPRLHLAIVGEFSSGKSTFINALLRRRLLKASCVATTASVTRILGGDAFSVTATFTDGSIISATESQHAALHERIARIKPAAAASLQRLLDLLTSDGDVASEVRDLQLVAPATIDEKLIILDTPGIGAGAAEATGHAELTEAVLENEADCVVVLVHATRGMTDTLLDFLEQHVKPFFRRCAFVISAMDGHGPDERAEIEALVRAILHQRLGIDRPLLFQSGAAAMLVAHDAADTQHWQSQFLFVESSLKSAMLRQRTLIIGEHLVRLLQEVLRDLSEDLETKLKELDRERSLLAGNSVATIETVLDEMYAECETALDKQCARLKTRASVKGVEFCAQTKSQADALIRSCGWAIKNYAQEVGPRLEALVQERGRAYAGEIDGDMSGLRKRCDEMSARFARRFEESYRSFPSLCVRIAVPSIAVATLPVRNVPFQASRGYVEEQNSGDRKGGGRGAATGAAVGLLFGPVGALVGALIGGGVGYTVAGDSLEARQQKVIASAGPEIDRYFAVCREDLYSFIDAAILATLRQVRAAVRAHVAQYGEAVGHLIRQHENEKQRLETAVLRATADQAELLRRRDRLENAQRRLASESPKGQT